MNAKRLILCLMAAAVMTAIAQVQPVADYRVLPLPAQVNGIKGGDFKLGPNCLINYPTGNRQMERNAELLSQYIEEMTGMHLSVRPTTSVKDRTGHISLLLDPTAAVGDEGYNIVVTGRGVEIVGRTAAGVFHGMQVLRQSIPVGETTVVALPASQVSSSPRFVYRGMHLDCSRHFFGV